MGIFRKKSGERQETSGRAESNDQGESPPSAPTPEQGMNVFFGAYLTVDGGVECKGFWFPEKHGIAIRFNDERSLAVFKDGTIWYFDKDSRRVDADSWQVPVRGEAMAEESTFGTHGSYD